MLTPKRLHSYLKASVQGVSSPAKSRALRALIEDTGAENFLSGLLFMQLQAGGHKVFREFHLTKRREADIAVHRPSHLYIEAKQLHVKDRGKYAPRKVKQVLKRHR